MNLCPRLTRSHNDMPNLWEELDAQYKSILHLALEHSRTRDLVGGGCYLY